MDPVRQALQAWRTPQSAFAGPAPGLGRALAGMAAVWMPLAFLNALGTLHQALRAYGTLRAGALPAPLWALLPVDPEDLRALLAALPPAPAFGRLWPWLLLGVPVGVLGTWLHHAVWDHTGLWLLRGTAPARSFRTSLAAEAEALRLAAPATLLGLAAFLPGVGWVLGLPLALLDGYLWLFRGFALAARHHCPAWKGVLATVLHAVLFGVFAVLMVGLALLLARAQA